MNAPITWLALLVMALILGFPTASWAQDEPSTGRCAGPRRRAMGAFVSTVRSFNQAQAALARTSVAATRSATPQMRGLLLNILHRARAMRDPDERDAFMERAHEIDRITTDVLQSSNVLAVWAAATESFVACNEVQFTTGVITG